MSKDIIVDSLAVKCEKMHPCVYMKIDADKGFIVCYYCGSRYVYKLENNK